MVNSPHLLLIALGIGALMNVRGLTELIVVTTSMASPLYELVNGRKSSPRKPR